MVDEDLEYELGQATTVYDDPGEGAVRKSVSNEHVAHFQDHWMVKVAEDEN